MTRRCLPQKLTKLPKEIGKIKKLSCGLEHTIISDDKDQIFAFGSNCYGQLGIGVNRS